MTSILQHNCQGSFAAMCSLGQTMLTSSSNFALVQEPYTKEGKIVGVPGRMRTFTDTRGMAAVILNVEADWECVQVDSNEWGVCVSVQCSAGKVLLASVYCQHSLALDPYILYLDRLLQLARGIPLIVGLDANASSQAWYSKPTRSPTAETHSLRRGDVLSEWVLSRGLQILNESSSLYTFSGPVGESDVEVTLASDAGRRLQFSWSLVLADVSDHNLIKITVSWAEVEERHPSRPVEKRWRTTQANWATFGALVRDSVSSIPLQDFASLTSREQVALLEGAVEVVCDNLFDRCQPAQPRKLKWWTLELERKKRLVRSLRKRFQRARRVSSDELPQHCRDFRTCLAEYKSLLTKTKEDHWRAFA